MVSQKAKATNSRISQRFTDEEVFDIIDQYYGNKSLIVAALESTPQQFEVWLRREDRKAALAKAREKILDKSEEKMIKLLDSEDDRVVFDTCKFLLQHLGRSRGYCGNSPAMQVDVKSGDDVKVRVQALFGITDE